MGHTGLEIKVSCLLDGATGEALPPLIWFLDLNYWFHRRETATFVERKAGTLPFSVRKGVPHKRGRKRTAGDEVYLLKLRELYL